MKTAQLKQLIKENIINILKESILKPKAIFLAGAPGAGKGYILRELDLSKLKILNIDNYFIDYLKQLNVSLDLKNADAQDRSNSAKAMAQATKDVKNKIPKLIESQTSFILDGTAASYKNINELKQELESKGYDTFMLYVYTDLERSLLQNQNRYEKSQGTDRSLNPSIVLRTWLSVTKNYSPFKELFGNNFVSVANTLEDESIKNIEQILKTYIEPFTPTDLKPKSEKEQQKSNLKKQKLNQEIQKLLNSIEIKNIIDNSVNKQEAQQKIQQFLNKN